ncbi:LysR substrate-binding domain-containing protein [Paludibacterium sp. THUN1379]|uniref:LysR substrate-binding domain-containing protein n=1 Tax=Paludibacterium sp. THUN1379 TaxID=3112107 RepID=UPI0030D50228
MPSTMSLQAFLAVARLGSLSRAASQLYRTQGAVSRQIQQLEQHYQRSLFTRSPEGMHLTADGEALLPLAQRALSELAAFAVLSRQQPETLRLRLPSTLALRWFLPRQASLQQQLPGLRLDITTSVHDQPDFSQREPDAMIVRGHGPWPGLHAQRLFAEHLTPMCSPDLARDLKQPADLQPHCLIHADADHHEWQTWWQQFGSGTLPGQSLIFDSLDSATSAAALGYGIALGDPRLSQEALARGELVMPFATLATRDQHYYLVIPEARRDQPGLQQLSAALQSLAG